MLPPLTAIIVVRKQFKKMEAYFGAAANDVIGNKNAKQNLLVEKD